MLDMASFSAVLTGPQAYDCDLLQIPHSTVPVFCFQVLLIMCPKDKLFSQAQL